MVESDTHTLDQLNYYLAWDCLECKSTDQYLSVLLYHMVLTFDLWHMRILCDCVKVFFLRE